MKKYIVICFVLIVGFFLWDIFGQELGLYIPSQGPVEVWTRNEGKTIQLDKGNGFEDFEIKGVDLGVGYPGKAATDYAINKETYKRWFQYIQEMGANTIRIYTINGDAFYDAFYEYNKDNKDPLFLIHGVWLNDYILNSHRDGYDDGFMNSIIKDSQTMIDVIHGNRKIFPNKEYGHGNYKNDISKWVLGYIIGVEWESVTVEFTNHMQDRLTSYKGKYMYTVDKSSPFEAMIAQIGDKIIDYESDRYAQQRLVAFSNWPTTDPLEHSDETIRASHKFSKLDVEHIKTTGEFISGTFASYHIYPYYPDYFNYNASEEYKDENGNKNTYYHYLKQINDHHTIPVIISEFGIPSSRGMAQQDQNTHRNQGFMSEKQQGQALADCYRDIKKAGCAGSLIFSWHDEWFKRTWNTLSYVDLEYVKNWSDYQTNEQYFGLLSFDPGEKRSICYVDGKTDEWKKDDLVGKQGDYSISMKYDEKFIYMKIDGYKDEKIYIPIDTLNSIGSQTMKDNNIKFERDSDFVIEIDGKENSRVLVNHRYNSLLVMNSDEVIGKNIYLYPPNKHTNQFDKIELMLQLKDKNSKVEDESRKYETGLLLHGNANPSSKDFNSLADFHINGSTVELKIPWQMLNFSSPSHMYIHDDYYLHYGVEKKKIDELFIGLGDKSSELIQMKPLKLKGWKDKVTFHERLKDSYYIVKDMWKK